MQPIRKTYAEINLRNIEENIRKIINMNNSYKYVFGVIKADSYGMGDIQDVNSILNGGCNYLAVATFEEALQLREKTKNIPILCFGNIPNDYLKECHEKNITVAINSLEYLNEIKDCGINRLKVHFKLNTGMNRLRNI